MLRLNAAVSLCLGVLWLAACHSHAPKRYVGDPAQNVASGSVLTLKQTIEIPAGSTSVSFQDTRLVAPGTLKPNYAYCRFGLDDPASAVREIKPNAFVVTSVDYEERSVGALGEAASLTRMNLQTELGAKGYHMTCMQPEAAGYARFVTVSEINAAVADFFTLTPAN